MRFEHIVLLIIAFNVVTAVVQRRAKKKARAKLEAAARSGRVQPAEAPSPRGWNSPEAEEGEWEDASRSEPVAEQPDRGQMPSLGRDILDQIARDLGLKTSPRPSPMPREPMEAPEPEWREREREVVRERPPRAAQPAPRLAEARAATIAPAPPVVPRARVSTPPVRARAATADHLPRVDLKSAAKLREAFILKEILDRPLALRRANTPGR
jgi:hypothetical protein